MNYKLLLTSSFIVLGFATVAQDANSTYAITGSGTGDFNWVNIRQINTQTATIEKTLYDNKASNAMMPVSGFVNNSVVKTSVPAMGYGVAAAAYDKVHNRLFFTQMHFGELTYIDLGKKDVNFNFAGSLLPRASGQLLTEESHFTRMVIGADGNGYAITNDANHLVRFTTGKNPVITDLGNIVDADANNGMSIHNKCSSWGGDMIADAYNKLYIISANHGVFVLDIDTRVATFKGSITGLPAAFSTNGAAVDADGKVIVSSATSFAGYYRFDINDLKATLIEGSDKVFNASDLANSNLLFQKEADAKNKFTSAPTPVNVEFAVANSKVFPNPVTGNEFKVLFDGQKAGAYTIIVTDLSGKNIMTKPVTISSKAQVETVKITSLLGKGMYFVKVTGASNEVIFTEKIIVQ